MSFISAGTAVKQPAATASEWYRSNATSILVFTSLNQLNQQLELVQ